MILEFQALSWSSFFFFSNQSLTYWNYCLFYCTYTWSSTCHKDESPNWLEAMNSISYSTLNILGKGRNVKISFVCMKYRSMRLAALCTALGEDTKEGEWKGHRCECKINHHRQVEALDELFLIQITKQGQKQNKLWMEFFYPN